MPGKTTSCHHIPSIVNVALNIVSSAFLQRPQILLLFYLQEVSRTPLEPACACWGRPSSYRTGLACWPPVEPQSWRHQRGSLRAGSRSKHPHVMAPRRGRSTAALRPAPRHWETWAQLADLVTATSCPQTRHSAWNLRNPPPQN